MKKISQNVSEQKYGHVYDEVDWKIWHSKQDFPKGLIFHINDVITLKNISIKIWI